MNKRAKKTIAKGAEGDEVLSGNNGHKGNIAPPFEADGVYTGTSSPGKTPPNPFDADFGEITNTDLDRILKVPNIDDMAGVVSRGNFRDDDARIAAVLSIGKAQRVLSMLKPTDPWYEPAKAVLEFLRMTVASTIGIKGLGKTLQLQSKTGLIAPALLREQLSLNKVKGDEPTIRKSDFRQETEDNEPRVRKGNN